MARITILNQFYVPDLSPTAHLSASLAQYLARQGHEVTVVTSRGGYVPASPTAAREEREGNPSIRRIWTPRLGKATVLKRCIDYGVFYLGTVWALLTMSRQDVVISLTTPPYIAWAGVLHRLLHPGTKLVLWNMDCYPELAERSDKLTEFGAAAQVMRLMNRTLFANLDHLIGLDTAMIELLMSQYAPTDRDLPVSIIPNWEQASFFPADAAPEPWKKASELGLDDQFVVLYLGNMGYGHQFDTVIDAAEILRHEPVKFLFIGGGSRWQAVDDARREKNLTNICLHDYVPKEDTPGVMAGADCALITLRDRILGVMSPSKLHSNLAMGLPVLYVGPKKSNVDDAIRRFGCGWSLRHGDAAGLVEAIRAMRDDQTRHRELKRQARAAFDAAYNDEVTLPQFDAVLASLNAPRDSVQPRMEPV